jgi:hypothetical protein
MEGITDQIMRYDKHTKRVRMHDTTGHVAFYLLIFALMAVLYTQTSTLTFLLLAGNTLKCQLLKFLL